jgi:hypothetical protein
MKKLKKQLPEFSGNCGIFIKDEVPDRPQE